MIRDGVKHGKSPIQILKNVNSLDPENPINIKVVQNEKVQVSKRAETKICQSKQHYRWFSNSHKPTSISNFIKAIHANNDQKLLEMRECATHGSVIGIDRTFNLEA